MKVRQELREIHIERARVAYAKYQRMQARIDAFEQHVTNMFPDNDRMVSNHLNNSDEADVWVYRALCKQRAIQEQIIATETAMASLYT